MAAAYYHLTRFQLMTMRAADLTTFIRVGIILVVACLILVGFNPFISIALFALALILDGVDGYLALFESSGGRDRPPGLR